MSEITTAFVSESTDYRCDCGQLLARLSLQGVELKCRRCKRIQQIPWKGVQIG